MAVQGSGVVGSTIDPAMQSRISFDARSGAAKRTQTNFPTHPGMENQTSMSGVGPDNPGSGPDGSAANPMQSEPRVRPLRKQPDVPTASWNMTDANGNGVDPTMAGRVLGDAILKDAGRIPASVTG